MAARDFRQLLDTQLKFVENSCLLYDSGHREEAIRLATCMRVIFHDKGRSTSLLTHVGADGVAMLSTCDTGPPHRRSLHAMVRWEFTAGRDDVHSVPLLDSAPSKRAIPREDWWNREIIFPIPFVTVTRRTLVLSAAEKDGGAHVDATLNPEYEQVINGFGITVTWQRVDEETRVPVGTPWVVGLYDTHLAGLRQLAYEVLNSPDILRLAGR